MTLSVGNHAIRSGSRSRPIFLKRKHVSGSRANCSQFQTPDQTRGPLAAHFAPYGEIGQSHGGARDAHRPKRDESRIRGPGRSDRPLVARQDASLGSHVLPPRHGFHHGIRVAGDGIVQCGSTVWWNGGVALEEVFTARFWLGNAARRTRRPELVRWRGANSPPKSRHATLGRQSSTAGHFLLPRNISFGQLGSGIFARHWAPDCDSGRHESVPQALPQHWPYSFS